MGQIVDRQLRGYGGYFNQTEGKSQFHSNRIGGQSLGPSFFPD
jgi:hypothetical protein